MSVRVPTFFFWPFCSILFAAFEPRWGKKEVTSYIKKLVATHNLFGGERMTGTTFVASPRIGNAGMKVPNFFGSLISSGPG